MSTDYYMTAVVGIPVRKKDLYTEIQVMNCKHAHDSKFCPECGKPAGSHTETVFISGIEKDEDNGGHLYRGLNIVAPLHLDDLREEDEVIIGVIIGKSVNHHAKHGRVTRCNPATDQMLLAIKNALIGSLFEDRERSLFMVLEARY